MLHRTEFRSTLCECSYPWPSARAYVRRMTIPSLFSRNCFTILDGEHVRVLWGDLEAAFEMGGVAHDPPLALIRAVLAHGGGTRLSVGCRSQARPSGRDVQARVEPLRRLRAYGFILPPER